jgi:hypothetical protein
MRQIISIWSLIILCTTKLLSQQVVTSFEKELLALEEQVYAVKSDTVLNACIYKKLQILLGQGITNERVLREVHRLTPNLLPDSLRKVFFWNASIISYLNDETNRAKSYINRYHELVVDTSIQYNLLSVLINAAGDTVTAANEIKKLSSLDSSFNCLTCLMRLNEFELKNKKAKVVASAVIPGLGSVMNGNVGKGLTSMALTGSFVVLTTYLLRNGCYVNAVGLGLAWGLKFYIGNIRLTEKLIEKKEVRRKNELTKKCELEWNKVLTKYPMLLK